MTDPNDSPGLGSPGTSLSLTWQYSTSPLLTGHPCTIGASIDLQWGYQAASVCDAHDTQPMFKHTSRACSSVVTAWNPIRHTVACDEVLVNAQVVHHPTVLAAYGEGRKWTFEGDAEVKSKFWGRSIELTPVGVLKLTFHDGEAFSWSKVCN